MEARDRSLKKWFERIESRELALPRFQRHEAWGSNEVAALLTSIMRELPGGAALILEVGDKLPFISRTLVGTPTEGERIVELLLDGQQRLTAVWRSLMEDYADRTYLVGFEDDDDPAVKVPTAYGQARWQKNGKRYPLWVDDPAQVWDQGLLPVSLLRPGEMSTEVNDWVMAAVGGDHQRARELDRRISDLRHKVASFNLPFLSLPPKTPKHVALDVFIKMNTSSVALTTFDILVAQVETIAGESLHDLVAKMEQQAPHARTYKAPEDLILEVAALSQDRTPSQAGYRRLDLERLVEEWPTICGNVKGMTGFLESQTVLDATRLPTDGVLAVIAALWSDLPDSPDALGNAQIVLRKYLWRAFFTGRYERAAGTNALNDYRALRAVLRGEKSEEAIQIFNESLHPLPTTEQLIATGWPKNRNILARAVLGASLRAGARDIADDFAVTREHLVTREYHHLFPAALLRDADVPDDEIFRALNCALITWRTNRTLSRKDPLVYLRERAEANSLGLDDLHRRLRSHLIPTTELSVGGYDTSTDEGKSRVREDYQAFLRARASLLSVAARQLCEGRDLDVASVFQAVA